MHHHIIVSGDDALATTIIEELKRAGASVVKLAKQTCRCRRRPRARRAEVARARRRGVRRRRRRDNLEIALLARRANPNVRVVARLANDVLRAAVADDNGPGAILNVAELAAPSVVEACLAHTTHPFEAAGIEFVVSGSEAPRDGDAARDLRRSGTGGDHSRRELTHPRRGGGMPDPGSAGPRR